MDSKTESGFVDRKCRSTSDRFDWKIQPLPEDRGVRDPIDQFNFALAFSFSIVKRIYLFPAEPASAEKCTTKHKTREEKQIPLHHG